MKSLFFGGLFDTSSGGASEEESISQIITPSPDCVFLELITKEIVEEE